MKRDERLHSILTLLDDQERVEVETLADHFDVSAETIRRDLATLSEQGLLRKVHGGAVKFQTAQENALTSRAHHNQAQKISIAQYAAQFVDSGDSLFLNSGTTTAVFAKELTKLVDGLIIITNSPVIANEFWNKGESNNRIYLLGGEYNGTEIDTVGSSVIDQIRQFRADHAILTVGTVSATQGFMDYRIEAAHVIRTMAQQARRTTILADSSKLGRTALVAACTLPEVHRLVTDSLPPDGLAQALDDAGTRLHVTNPVG
jgi:DeoR family glycerol-3-phosphate regulon repressor